MDRISQLLVFPALAIAYLTLSSCVNTMPTDDLLKPASQTLTEKRGDAPSVGMTKQQVLAKYGRPGSRMVMRGVNGEPMELWTYDRRTILEKATRAPFTGIGTVTFNNSGRVTTSNWGSVFQRPRQYLTSPALGIYNY